MIPGEKIQLPPCSYEQRAEFYHDVEKLINPGFLTANVVVEGVRLSFRTLFHGDHFLMNGRCDGSNRDWLLWSVAHSTWMVDGQVILGDANSPLELYDFYGGLHKSALHKLVHLQYSLNRKLNSSVDTIRIYNEEDVSRYVWKQQGKVPVNSPLATGIPGTELLGMNPVQKMWVMYNDSQDKRDIDRGMWDNSKFLASAFNQKGMKAVEQRSKTRDETDEKLKQDRFDEFFYGKVGLAEDGKSKTARSIKSIPDLVNEYKDWVEGNLDHHDLVVEKYKESLVSERMQIVDSPSLSINYGESNVEGFVAFELNNIPDEAKKPRRNIIYDEGKDDSNVFKNHVVSEVSLQDRISSRMVTMKSGKDGK